MRMGNNKNKRNNNNNHRHVFVKRCHPEKYKGKSVQCTQRKQKSTSHDGLQGCRIINIQQLQQYITTLSSHAVQCSSDIVLVGERRDGLASIISSRCSKCGYNIPLETSTKVRGAKGYQRWECNLAAVWYQMSTGGGDS